MERYHEIANELDLNAVQRTMYFSLGAEQERYYFSAEAAHDAALWALNAVNWKSIKAARAMTSLIR